MNSDGWQWVTCQTGVVGGRTHTWSMDEVNRELEEMLADDGEWVTDR